MQREMRQGAAKLKRRQCIIKKKWLKEEEVPGRIKPFEQIRDRQWTEQRRMLAISRRRRT